jgi:hypothetical protein
MAGTGTTYSISPGSITNPGDGMAAAGLGGLLAGVGSQMPTTTTSSGTQTSSNSFSPAQTSLQSSLMAALNSLMGGSASPAIQGAQTQSADQINSEYSSMGDRMNRFLAARGFGSSGQVGSTALKTELGRQSSLAGNTATYGQMGLNEMNTALSDSLTAAFASPTTTTTSNGTQTNSGNLAGGAMSGAGGALAGMAPLMAMS